MAYKASIFSKQHIFKNLLFVYLTLLLFDSCRTSEKASGKTLVGLDQLITIKDVTTIEHTLAADEMRGRKVYTPEIDRAADFISDEFKAIGLQAWGKSVHYKQEFSMVRSRLVNLMAAVNGKILDTKDIVIVSSQPDLKINQSSGYEIATIAPGSNFFREVSSYTQANKNLLVLVDTIFSQGFSRLSSYNRSFLKTDKNVIFILGNIVPVLFSIEAKLDVTEQKLANVVGILPGKSRQEESVIFSAHFDHLGTGKPVNGDSIYNGANDDAAGVTAVIMLAKYFKALNKNERTIIFAAFTAEEIGGIGSQFFSRQADAEKVVAMFNIEMIGTESKWGKNSAYITGYEKTDMGQILQKNLEGTGFTFYPDPYPAQQLFYRSDNATLARLGVPAHTISTSKMDNEPNYHKVSDEVSSLDLENMTMIIKAIALSSQSIIAGTETPARVNVEELR